MAAASSDIRQVRPPRSRTTSPNPLPRPSSPSSSTPTPTPTTVTPTAIMIPSPSQTTFSVPTSATRTGSPHTQGATTAVRPSTATSPVRTSSSLSKPTSWSSSHFGQRATTTVRPSTATSPAKTPTSPSKTTSSSSPARCGQRATRPARPSTATSPPKTPTSPSKMTSSSSSSHPGQRMTTAVRPSTATSPFKTPTSLSKTRSSSSSAHSGQKARTNSSSSSSRRPSTAASITKVPGTDSEQRSITSRRRSSIRCQSASSHSPNADDLERGIPRRSSSAASLTLRVKQQHPETRAVTATSSRRRFSAGSVLMMNSSSASPDHGHRGVSWSGLASPTSPVHSGIHGPRTPTSPSWLLGPDRPRSLQRRASTRSFLFSKSSEVAAAGRPLSQRSPIPAPHSAPGRRDTRKLFYNAGLMALHTRRISGGSQRGRRESSAGQGQGRRSSSGHAGRRQGSGERLAQITSVVKIMALHRRVQARKIKRLWGKVRLWTRIICVLASMLRKYAAAAMEDPSSPFYSHTPGNLVPDLVVPAVDKDHYMFFDPAFFKANRQRRMSQEVQKILTKASDERTPEELNHAMIGLRDIPQLAVFPVRMQKNLAQFGHFQCLPAKRMVLKQGHSPEGFYIILYGNVAVAVKNEETGFVNIVVELPRGESFGELSIVSGGLRNSSVLTTTYTELLCISKAVYQTIFAGGVRNIDDPEHTEFVGSLSFLRGWPVEKIWDKESRQHVRFMYIQRNGVIMRDSNHNNWLIVVRSGSVTVLKKLVHTRPTVSARTGLYRNPSPTTAFHTFLSDRRDHARWLSARSITLPPPLQLPPGHSDGEEGEEEEEEEERQEVEELEEDSHEEEEIVEEEEEEEEEEEGEENVEDEGIGDIEHNDDDRDDENEDEENGEEEEEEEEAGRGRRRKRGVVVLNVRPQTCGGGRGSSPSPPSPPLPPGGNSLPPRKAWSARHPSRLPGPYVPPCKRTRQKRDKIQFEADSTATQPGVRTAAHFASAKRTLLDDLDASFLATDRPVTEADINPQFVYVQTLTKGDVFGLAPLVFSDQPSLCLVSNGAECLMIDRRFYLDNCPPPLSRRLKTEVSPYPSEAKLQQDLVNRINWDVYKRVVKRQVWEQSKTRGRPRTS